jgi:hypothetical protein
MDAVKALGGTKGVGVVGPLTQALEGEDGNVRRLSRGVL